MKYHAVFFTALIALLFLNSGCRSGSADHGGAVTSLPADAVLIRDSSGELVSVALTGKSDLDRLEITAEDIATIAQHSSVTSLSLQFTSVNDEALQPLENLKNLQLIDLAYTNVDGNCLTLLSRLPKLASVRLEGCNISNEKLAPLKTMPQLVDLYLGRTGISDEGLAHIRGLKNLVLLDLSDCDVSDDGLSSLGILPQIRRLWLSKKVRHGDDDRSKLTDASVTYLGTLDSLVELQIADSQLTENGLRQLKEKLPNTKISTERTGITYKDGQ